MTDCPNGDVRDLLPGYLHDRLDLTRAAEVEAHLETCATCRAELALLGGLRGVLHRVPAVDVASIAAAIPAYRRPARPSWAGWRVAAAITVIVAGGASLVVVDPVRSPGGAGSTETASAARPADAVRGAGSGPAPSLATDASPVADPATTVAMTHPAAAQGGDIAERELAMASSALTDLSDRELTSLLHEIEALDAVPSIDVERAVTITSTSPEQGEP